MSSLPHAPDRVQPDLFSEPFRLYPPELDELDDLVPPIEPDAPGVPLLPFPDWLAVKAQLLRLDDTDAAWWLSRRIDGLAALARQLQATCPDEFDAREEVLDSGERDTLRARGFDQGVAAARPLR